MSAIIEVDFNNTYLIKQTYGQSLNGRPNANNNRQMAVGPGIAWPGGIDLTTSNDRQESFYANFYIEESRIRGGFNTVSIDPGVRAFLNDPNPLQQNRFNTLIYSGIYNSRTGVNNTNVFSTGTDITKSLDPENGSIQRTLAEDTNMIVFQENKISRALIDKDTIYTTESGTQTQSGAAVIGQFVPYKGVYGISKNPESLANYGFRKYFSDKNRNAILRLSNDGLTEISAYGMEDYFRDELAKVKNTRTTYSIPAVGNIDVDSGGAVGDITLTCDFTGITPLPSTGMTIRNEDGYITKVDISSAPSSVKIFYSTPFTTDLATKGVIFQYSETGKVKGAWDVHNRNYIVSLQESPVLKSKTEEFQTLAFDDKVNGWVSFYTYKPETMFSVKNKYFSTQEVGLFKHYSEVANTRNTFYGVSNPSTITCVFNVQPSLVKNFKTVGYEGSSGWEVEFFKSDFTGANKLPAGTYVENQDQTLSVKSYEEGKYIDPTTGQTLNAGFNRKENIYVANIISNSVAMPNEVSFGNQITGIRGFVATVKFKTDDTTQLGGTKQLWSTRSEYVNSTGF
tara:strand:+ start:6361 stop:8061 length:1701 start_codon:yes stop_codon:yes gene_type:complete